MTKEMTTDADSEVGEQVRLLIFLGDRDKSWGTTIYTLNIRAQLFKASLA